MSNAKFNSNQMMNKLIEFIHQSKKIHSFDEIYNEFSIYTNNDSNFDKDLFYKRFYDNVGLFNINDIYYNDKQKVVYFNGYNKINIQPNIIYYGAPGTGKSKKIKDLLINEDSERIFRTMFHEEYSYFDFMGQYKPVIYEQEISTKYERVFDEKGIVCENERKPLITYKFVPGIFIKSYIEAYKNTNKDVYLIIEELNRGNCSSIFGDVFQLLDRDKSGESEYPISPVEEIQIYLSKKNISNMPINHLSIPSNLKIIATMNTSDQSLFPIDSAFKRRWDLEFIPIDLKKDTSLSKITIEGTKTKWITFVEIINQEIYNKLGSENKQIGQYFLKEKNNEILMADFKNKVLHYLYFDVFKHYQKEIFDEKTFSQIMLKTKIKDFFSNDISDKI